MSGVIDLTVRDRTMALYGRHVNSGMAKIFRMSNSPLEISSDGLFVYTDDERRYLDCGGYCVFFLGHGHPSVREAVAAQLYRHPVTSRMMADPVLAEAAAELARVAPEGLDYVWFGHSGTEAVEAALKLARLSGCRSIVSTSGAFHGKTFGALSVSGQARYREPFEPLLPGVQTAPYGDLAALEACVERSPNRCAVILEPIQSEAGVIIPPHGYVRGVREICDRHGALMICDEISTGLGRTGYWWSVDREDVRPDVLVVGKALGGGVLAASAVVTTSKIFEPLNRDPLLHTATFSGNPLVAAAVVATIEAIEQDGLVQHAMALGQTLLAELRAAAEANAPQLVIGVRGQGLLIGVEFAEDHHAATVMLELLERNVLVSHSLHAHNVMRITPPALLDECAKGMLVKAFAESIAAATSQV